MKIQPIIEKVLSSKAYQEFEKKNKDAFLVAGFFVLDFESGKNLQQIDYYVPGQKKVAAFNVLEKEIGMQMLTTMNDKIPEKLDHRTNIDLEALKGILEDGMKNRNMTEEIKKIIAVIQTIEGKKTWILNCILSGMEILKAHVDDESETILTMEKASVLDYIKRASPETLTPRKEGMPTKADVDKKIEQLDKLKKALEEEKKKLGDSEK